MKIYLRGFFFSNLGDDLFVHMIAKRYPQHTFMMAGHKGYEKSFVHESNVRFIAMDKMTRGICKICKINVNEKIEKKADLSVIISGSVFQEYENDTKAMERLLNMPGMNNPTYILGSNFGPYHTERYFQAAEQYFTRMKDICFRDVWSYELFSEIPQVRYAPDIVFNVDKIVDKPLKKGKLCAISVINFDTKEYLNQYRENYENFILHTIEYYASKQYQVVLMSFCKNEGDETAIERIEAACSPELRKCIKIENYDGTNWKEMVSTIGSTDCLIATRFHSMILGMVYQVPVLPIVYNDKVLHVLEDLGKGSCGVRLENLKNTDISQTEFILLDEIEEIKKQADKQFAALDAIL